MNTDKFGAFVVALNALSTEHGVVIGGCGCCGSPWLDPDVGPGALVFYRVSEDGSNLKAAIAAAEDLK